MANAELGLATGQVGRTTDGRKVVLRDRVQEPPPESVDSVAKSVESLTPRQMREELAKGPDGIDELDVLRARQEEIQHIEMVRVTTRRKAIEDTRAMVANLRAELPFTKQRHEAEVAQHAEAVANGERYVAQVTAARDALVEEHKATPDGLEKLSKKAADLQRQADEILAKRDAIVAIIRQVEDAGTKAEFAAIELRKVQAKAPADSVAVMEASIAQADADIARMVEEDGAEPDWKAERNAIGRQIQEIEYVRRTGISSAEAMAAAEKLTAPFLRS